jgi:hypothetical protein
LAKQDDLEEHHASLIEMARLWRELADRTEQPA